MSVLNYHLILTLDYELFGNGSGCLEHCVTAPTRMCLESLATYHAGLELFVDALEFTKIEQYQEVYGAGMQQVRNQLTGAVAEGHQLQLHLHPQWLNARFLDGSWQLDMAKWRIGNLSPQDVERCVLEGVNYINELTAPVGGDSRSHCRVFRAGGWAIQPSKEVLKAISRAGVVMDSTVAPGCYNPARGDWYDFRKVPSVPFWPVEEDVCTMPDHWIMPDNHAMPDNHRSDNHAMPDNHRPDSYIMPNKGGRSLLEVPIATAKVGRISHGKALKEHRSGQILAANCAGSYAGANTKWQDLRGKLSKILRMGTVMLDFSTMPGWMLVEITKHYQRTHAEFAGPVPIVAIAHNKNFTAASNRHLKYWLNWVTAESDIRLSSYADWFDAHASSDYE